MHHNSASLCDLRKVALEVYEKMPHLKRITKKEISADDKDSSNVGKHTETFRCIYMAYCLWCAVQYVRQ